jgi:hypothetical protein
VEQADGAQDVGPVVGLSDLHLLEGAQEFLFPGDAFPAALDEGSRWAQRALFMALALLPITYLLSMAFAWRHRAGVRAKSGTFGMFSLWFPLLTTLAAAWVILYLVPHLLGTPTGTITLFQPDLGVLLLASAAAGVLWALFMLGVAYTGRSNPA